MNNTFEEKVRAAAVAGWWTILIAVAFIVLQWLVYLTVIHTRPSWFLSMWGQPSIGPSSNWSGSGP